MINRFSGACACGTFVLSQEGVAFKSVGRWAVRCASCEREANAPVREMLGTIFWPNGLGATVCTVEYEEAVSANLHAQAAVREFDGDTRDPADRARLRALEHAAYLAENKVAGLQADGGHVGERIHYEKPDPMTALLGGGSINVRPGGEVVVASQFTGGTNR